MNSRHRIFTPSGTMHAAVSLCFVFGCGSGMDDRLTDAQVSVETPCSVSPLIFEARGRDFKWHFLTQGPDGKFGSGDEQSVGNELIVPPAAEVTLVLTSEDYVYTLNVPDGRVEIAVPEMEHVVQFTSPAAGTHEFRTDPLCGLRYFHDDVLGTMRIAGSRD